MAVDHDRQVGRAGQQRGVEVGVRLHVADIGEEGREADEGAE